VEVAAIIGRKRKDIPEKEALDTIPRGEDGYLPPDRFLKPGDVVEAWVEGIGVLRNPVVAKK